MHNSVRHPAKLSNTLDYTDRLTRNENNNKVQSIKKLANDIEFVIKNLIENVADQSQKDTLV